MGKQEFLFLKKNTIWILQIKLENAKIIPKVFNRDILKSQFSSSGIQIILIFNFLPCKKVEMNVNHKYLKLYQVEPSIINHLLFHYSQLIQEEIYLLPFSPERLICSSGIYLKILC